MGDFFPFCQVRRNAVVPVLNKAKVEDLLKRLTCNLMKITLVSPQHRVCKQQRRWINMALVGSRNTGG